MLPIILPIVSMQFGKQMETEVSFLTFSAYNTAHDLCKVLKMWKYFNLKRDVLL